LHDGDAGNFWAYFNTTANEQLLVEKYIENFSETPPGWFLTKLDDNSLRFGTGPSIRGPRHHFVPTLPSCEHLDSFRCASQ